MNVIVEILILFFFDFSSNLTNHLDLESTHVKAIMLLSKLWLTAVVPLIDFMEQRNENLQFYYEMHNFARLSHNFE